MENIYRFLRDTGYAEEHHGLAEQHKNGLPAAVISGAGLLGENKLCVKALNLFASILGAQAGNLVLTFLATGGIYLGGGIPPKIREKLKDGATVGAFLAKGRLSSLVEDTPLYVISNEHTALLGAASIASKLWLVAGQRSKMKRIVIIGCGGSGKSTLARRMGTSLSIPVRHLDRAGTGRRVDRDVERPVGRHP